MYSGAAQRKDGWVWRSERVTGVVGSRPNRDQVAMGDFATS